MVDILSNINQVLLIDEKLKPEIYQTNFKIYDLLQRILLDITISIISSSPHHSQ